MVIILLLFALNKMLEYYVEEKGVCDILALYTIQFILTNIAPMGDFSVILEPAYLLIFISLRDDAFLR